MPDVVIQFSRAAPPTWKEMIEQFSPFNYSMIICRLTHSPFSHVDVCIGEGLLGASNAPYCPILASYPPGNASGVALRPPNCERMDVMRQARINVTQDQKDQVEQYCKQQLGKPFDKSALKAKIFLSGDFTNRDWREPDKWYCAELVARAFEIANILVIPGVKNRVTAGDLILLLWPFIKGQGF